MSPTRMMKDSDSVEVGLDAIYGSTVLLPHALSDCPCLVVVLSFERQLVAVPIAYCFIPIGKFDIVTIREFRRVLNDKQTHNPSPPALPHFNLHSL